MTAVWMRCFSALLALAALALPARAHQASDAYLQLGAREDGGIALRVDIALRDLDAALDLDADLDGRLTWGEIRTAWPRVEAYALDRVRIEGCVLRAGGRALERRADGAYAVLRLESPCSLPAHPVVGYGVLREIDPTHRGLLKIERGGQAAELVVLDPARSAPPAAGERRAAPSFLEEGVRHILGGYDHVLFLLCLMLPAAMRRTPRGWQPVGRLGEALRPVVGVVTGFTVAHSVTLALAALKLVELPAAFIEPAIAATIVVAAIDNLHPLFGGRRGAMTFFFGLVHGFGFAGALAELDLAPGAFAWALLRFNLGLELGQLAIVIVAVSALFALRRASAYARLAIGGGSAAAMALGALWLVERTTALALQGP